nr:unnamed protein product [Callosobruchus analis]
MPPLECHLDARSPPRSRTMSLPDVERLRQPPEVSNTKRKRNEQEESTAKMGRDELGDTIQGLLQKAKRLEEYLKATVNTKSEIKKTGGDILLMAMKLQRLNRDRLRSNATEKQSHQETQTDLPSKTSIGVQVDIPQSEDHAAKEIEEARMIQSEIAKGVSYSDFQEIAKKRWPRTVFQKVMDVTGDLMQAPWEQDLVNITTCDLDMSKGLARRFRDKYGGLDILKAQKQELGGVAYMVNTISIPLEDKLESKTRWKCFMQTRYRFLPSLVLWDSSTLDVQVEMLYADQVPVPPFPGTVGLIDSRCASLTYPLKPPQYAHNLGTANLTFRQDCGSLLLLTSLVSFFP